LQGYLFFFSVGELQGDLVLYNLMCLFGRYEYLPDLFGYSVAHSQRKFNVDFTSTMGAYERTELEAGRGCTLDQKTGACGYSWGPDRLKSPSLFISSRPCTPTRATVFI
jgi:hypothetical protein